MWKKIISAFNLIIRTQEVFMKTRIVAFLAVVLGVSAFLCGNAEEKNPTLPGDFYLDSDSDSDIDPGAENWTNGYFESETVDKLPVYDNFHSWLKQMTHLYKWRLLLAEEQNGYYFAVFAIGLNASELAFCFHRPKGRNHPLQLKVQDINDRDLRLKQWGPNASVVQEYNVNNPDTGEVLKVRELNGYVIRMHRFPRHLRLIAAEVNGIRNVIFDKVINNVVDSVRNIQNIATEKLPDTSTIDKWIQAVSLPSWKLVKKVENTHGFFAVFKLNDKTFAFCRQLHNNPGIYRRETALKLLDLSGKPLHLTFANVLTLNRRYRVYKMVGNDRQLTKYSIIDGSTYRVKNALPENMRIQFIMRGDSDKAETFFDEKVDFSK
jgi:hypothetical protein